jgi:aspartate/methionine/tyrosine aminotransferase
LSRRERPRRFDAINALIEPGDEVVLIEPLYDCYLPLVKRAGGVPRLVRVTPPDWALDEAALARPFRREPRRC